MLFTGRQRGDRSPGPTRTHTILEMMKAVVNTKYGSPDDVLRIKDVPTPVPKDDEVLVKIHATTVNRTDYGILTAKPFIVRFFYGLTRPKNTILGNEFAGTIEAVGKGVTSFTVGDPVFGYDDATFGAHAQYKGGIRGGSVGNAAGQCVV